MADLVAANRYTGNSSYYTREVDLFGYEVSDRCNVRCLENGYYVVGTRCYIYRYDARYFLE